APGAHEAAARALAAAPGAREAAPAAGARGPAPSSPGAGAGEGARDGLLDDHERPGCGVDLQDCDPREGGGQLRPQLQEQPAIRGRPPGRRPAGLRGGGRRGAVAAPAGSRRPAGVTAGTAAGGAAEPCGGRRRGRARPHLPHGRDQGEVAVGGRRGLRRGLRGAGGQRGPRQGVGELQDQGGAPARLRRGPAEGEGAAGQVQQGPLRRLRRREGRVLGRVLAGRFYGRVQEDRQRQRCQHSVWGGDRVRGAGLQPGAARPALGPGPRWRARPGGRLLGALQRGLPRHVDRRMRCPEGLRLLRPLRRATGGEVPELRLLHGPRGRAGRHAGVVSGELRQHVGLRGSVRLLEVVGAAPGEARAGLPRRALPPAVGPGLAAPHRGQANWHRLEQWLRPGPVPHPRQRQGVLLRGQHPAPPDGRLRPARSPWLGVRLGARLL
ncbi:unnamed protein product, partial [Prorocentrum cordatum]